MQLPIEQLTLTFKALFNTNEPAGLRLSAALAGDFASRFYTDNVEQPLWGVVQETEYGTIYLGGAMDAPTLHALITELRQQGEVLIGLWPDDAREALLPPAPYQGLVVDFTDRPMGKGLEPYLALPPGCELKPTYRIPDQRGDIPPLQHFELVRGEATLCQAGLGPVVDGMVEIGVTTNPGHYGNGYATVTCAHLIQYCEMLGYQTYWNCNKSNAASMRLAQKLGYRRAQEYRLWAW